MAENGLSFREQRTAELAERRSKRTSPVGPNYRLTIPEENKRADLEYRWINDDAKGNVQAKTAVDTWDFVTSDEIAGDPRNTTDGSRIERRVGVAEDGKPLKAYLVCKPKAWFEEDKARKNAAHNELMKQIHNKPIQTAGSADLSHDEAHAYVPNEAQLPGSKSAALGIRRR